MNVAGDIGRQTRRVIRHGTDFIALLTILLRARFQLSHRSRRRIFRMLYHKQIYYTGVRGQFVNIVIAALVGSLLVFRLPVLSKGEQIVPALSQLFETVVVNELAPLLCGLILIARSGTAVTSKIGFLKVFREFEILKGMGIDPVHLFLVPVFFAFPISILIMVVVFDASSLFSAYLTLWVQGHVIPIKVLLSNVIQRIDSYDVIVILIKCLLSSFIIGFYSIYYGSNMQTHLTHVAKTMSDATTRQFVLVFTMNVAISILAYIQ